MSLRQQKRHENYSRARRSHPNFNKHKPYRWGHHPEADFPTDSSDDLGFSTFKGYTGTRNRVDDLSRLRQQFREGSPTDNRRSLRSGFGPYKEDNKREEKPKPTVPFPTEEPQRTPDDVPPPGDGLDDIVEQTEPWHPIEDSDEAEDEGETREQPEPRTTKPRYGVFDCAMQELLTGIPCNVNNASIQIQTSKKSNELGKNKKNRKSGKRYRPYKKSSYYRHSYTGRIFG